MKQCYDIKTYKQAVRPRRETTAKSVSYPFTERELIPTSSAKERKDKHQPSPMPPLHLTYRTDALRRLNEGGGRSEKPTYPPQIF